MTNCPATAFHPFGRLHLHVKPGNVTGYLASFSAFFSGSAPVSDAKAIPSGMYAPLLMVLRRAQVACATADRRG
jgi:hypothetical protein